MTVGRINQRRVQQLETNLATTLLRSNVWSFVLITLL